MFGVHFLLSVKTVKSADRKTERVTLYVRCNGKPKKKLNQLQRKGVMLPLTPPPLATVLQLHGDVNNVLCPSSCPVFRDRCACLTKWHRGGFCLTTQQRNNCARVISKAHNADNYKAGAMRHAVRHKLRVH
jgi:hypothetical protein